MESLEATIKQPLSKLELDLMQLVRDMCEYLVKVETKVNHLEKRLAELEQSSIKSVH